MHAYAAILVANHIDTMLAESAANRRAKLARHAARTNRVASTLKAVRSLRTTPAGQPLALPQLADYPYRS
jgi:hypothetical protein